MLSSYQLLRSAASVAASDLAYLQGLTYRPETYPEQRVNTEVTAALVRLNDAIRQADELHRTSTP